MHRSELQAQALQRYGQYLSSAPWDCMMTLTDPGMSHPEAMAKRTRYFMAKVNTSLYGNNWRRRTDGIEWVTGYEQQRRGAWHTHSLIRLPDHDINDPSQFSLAYWQRFATELGGFAHLTRPRNQEAITTYVCKYVLKDGNIDLSPGFDPRLPRARDLTIEGTARVH